MANVEIREHTPGKDVKDFIRAGFVVFADDPMWVPPLDFEFKERLSPKHNPFFKRAEVALFTAWKDGKLAGRCSATIDREYLKLWKDDTGFFGFFDTIEDQDVANALMRSAEKWLSSHGMKKMIGPLSLYANDEIGCLIEGFDYPPNLMMAHSRKYQAALIEGTGCEKEKDLLCWKYEANQGFPDRVVKAWEQIKALPEVKLRSVDPSRMERELEDIMDIYNSAWSGKWGMVPALPDEVKKIAKDMKLIIDPDIAFMAEINGKSVGMCIMLPNMNEAIGDLGGKLFPFGFAKLLWRLKVKHPESARLMMLGIKGEARSNVKRYGGLSAAMYVEVAKRGYAKGYRWGELSWTREDDAPINLGIRAMGAKVYKKYRVFRKTV
jgi:hypothetical protein